MKFQPFTYTAMSMYEFHEKIAIRQEKILQYDSNMWV